ncbi:MAG: Lon protease 2 [Anaerolineales bacterium]|nr:Lon protease 2 [Anaerolineales bacterium]
MSSAQQEEQRVSVSAVPQQVQQDAPDIPDVLPILPLRNVVVFPRTFVPLTVGQPRSIQLVDEAAVGNRIMGLVATKDPSIETPGPGDVYTTGTAAYIHRMIKGADGNIGLFVQGLSRIDLAEWVAEEPYLQAHVSVVDESPEMTIELQALMRNTGDLFRRMVELVPHMPEELMEAALNIEDPAQLVYFIASNIRMDLEDAQNFLEISEVVDKFRSLTAIMNRELEVLELGRKIQTEAQEEMEKTQREYFLRQQLKAIQQELGEGDEQAMEVTELREKIEESGMPEEAHREATRELSRLEKLPPQAAEYGVIRTYLEWMTEMPWAEATEDNLEIGHARQVLDEDHYDLDDIKDRILEYLAVQKLRQERMGTEGGADVIDFEVGGAILSFIGPPGVGKTSLGQSIARALGREFIRMSLGGVRDEAEIRGHRRTYIGAMPGRIVQGIRRAGTKNPVFMLDEIDKVAADWRGDPSSALLEVLDPAQNKDFRDHYLDVPFDLSQVLFIATGNVLSTISPPLRDRMEIIQLSGYTENDKVHIAEGYLAPRQVKQNGLREDEIEFTAGALRRVIRDYTREAGVRNLEREIGKVCRKVATKIAEGGVERTIVEEDDVPAYLGPQRFFFECADRTELPGVATGLAATATGGDVLFIEATKMPGGKGFQVTGQLGDVMKESAQAALSYVRSKSEGLGIPSKFFNDTDVHLHVPAGAIPKDGPSAGVTMATALASLLTGRPIRADIGMTGEITLRGKVLPVGGIKEKVMAAHRAGLRTVILPERNEKDLENIPEEIREEMQFVFIEGVGEVFDTALRDEVVELAFPPQQDGPGERDQAEKESPPREPAMAASSDQ